MLNKNPEARPDARALVNALHALAPAAPQAPAAPPSANQVSRLLPILAFGTPVGVLLLIGLGIIVIEHFLPPAAQDVPIPMQHKARITRNVLPQSATENTPGVAGRSAPRPMDEAAKTHHPAQNPAEPDAYLASLDKQRVELRIKRTELLLKYTEQHPDVVLVDRQLEQLRIERRDHLRQLRKN
jgi:eukaryotic-like serine/threonine-protein kinase